MVPMSTPSEPTPLEVLGRRVKARRVELKMKQAVQLARRMGITPRVIGDIENGRRTVGDNTYIALENELRWRRGSVASVLSGGEPDEIPDGVLEGAGSLRPDGPTKSEPERLFEEWADLYTQLLTLEFRYSSARDIDLGRAQEELREILQMAQDTKDGRLWAPPWKWNRPGEPWREEWLRSTEGREWRMEVRRDLGVLYDRMQERREGQVSDVDETLPAAAKDGGLEDPGENSI